MYFTGYTDLTLYSNVRLDENDTLFFWDRQDQEKYFNSKRKQVFFNCKFIKEQYSLVVPLDYNFCLRYNYLSFVNRIGGEGNEIRTFYCFINSYEMISDQATRINFSVDVLQTYFLDVKLTECFNVRGHEPFDSLSYTEEEITFSDMRVTKREIPEIFKGDLAIVVGVTDVDGKNVSGMYNGIFSGVAYWYCHYSMYTRAKNFIQDFCDAGKADAISTVFMCPINMLTDDENPTSGYVESTLFTTEKEYFTFTMKTDIEGYRPRNKKLLQYPYNLIRLICDNGNSIVLKPELFSTFGNTNEFRFDLNYGISGLMTAVCTPRDYAGQDYAYSDEIELGNFPLCTWNNDTYANWLAQNSNTIRATSENAKRTYNTTKATNALELAGGITNSVGSVVSGTISSTASAAVGNIPGAVANSSQGALQGATGIISSGLNYASSEMQNNTNYKNAIASLTASVDDASIQPNTAKGSASANAIDLVRGTHAIRIEQLQIKREDAERLDKYLDYYGYNIKRIQVPDVCVRENYTYIETLGCDCVDKQELFNVPMDYKKRINYIFDTGVRFWRNPENFKNFSCSND